MNTPLRQRKFWIWSLCIALLVARISGAHWHLCFDGSEPAAMMHVAESNGHHESAVHHEHGVHHEDNQHEDDRHYEHGTPHNDVDLNLADNGLLKLLGKNLATAMAIVALFALIVPARRYVPAPHRARYFPAFSHHRIALPRAPPL